MLAIRQRYKTITLAWRPIGQYCVQADNFQFNADYLVLTYEFSGGTDLDIRARVVTPNIGQDTQSKYIGWGVASLFPSVNPIIEWGGDNRGAGKESVLIDLIRFKAAYPSANQIVVDLRAFWFETVGTPPVSISGKLYKGGTIVKHGNDGTINAFNFTNKTATSTYNVESAARQITLQTQSGTTSGQRVVTLTYNVSTGTGQFDVNDTTTPTV